MGWHRAIRLGSMLLLMAVAAGAKTPESDDKPQKYVCLTFDDGPRPEFLHPALELFDRKQVKVTFFMCGNNIAAHPALVTDVAERGHEVENHSYSHPQLTRCSVDRIRSEFSRTNKLIEQATGLRPRYMRPPYGAQNATVRAEIDRAGMEMALWTIDPYDWQGSATVNRTTTRVLGHLHRNAVILLHEGPVTLKALPGIIDGIRERGYTIITYGELMRWEAEGARPTPRLIEIRCGQGGGDDATLAAGCGYALERGLRAINPSGWADPRELRFKLLVPASTVGLLQIDLLGGADEAATSRSVAVEEAEVGTFSGAQSLTVSLAAEDTADGEVAVAVKGLDGASANVGLVSFTATPTR